MTNENNAPENNTSQPDNTSNANVSDSANKSAKSKSAKDKPVKRKGGAFKRLFWYVVLVIIIATIAWLVVEKPYQQLDLDFSQASDSETVQQVDDTAAQQAGRRFSDLEKTVTALERQLSALRADVNAIETTEQDTATQRRLSELASALDRQRQELNQLSRQLPQQQAAQITQWRLFEAKQTVSAAARLIWGAEDYAAALKLLQIADSQLAGIETASAMQIRQLLASDIARVESTLDSQNHQLALSLAGLQQRIADLPDQVEDRSVNNNESTQQVSSNPDDWRSNLSANWDQFLNTFIRIQPSTSNAEPLLTESQRSAMTLRLELLLTMAQHAVIKGNSTLWRTHIDNALPLIEALKGNNDAANDVVQRLRALRNMSITRVELTELQSLDALSQAVSQGGLQ